MRDHKLFSLQINNELQGMCRLWMAWFVKASGDTSDRLCVEKRSSVGTYLGGSRHISRWASLKPACELFGKTRSHAFLRCSSTRDRDLESFAIDGEWQESQSSASV
jgi:hypothetical protein